MPEHVVAFADLLSDLGLAQSSVTRTVISVRGVYRYLATEGITQTDPTANFETASTPNALPKALTEDEVLAILNAVGELAAEGDPIGTRDLALLEFLYGTGARVSEACGIDFVDLDLDGALVRVMGKRSKERIVPLGGPSTRALRNYLDFGRPELISGKTQDRADSSAVFIGQRGRRLSRQAAWVAIRKWAVAAGVEADVSPHVMRHSCATHMLDNGADIRTVAELLGHVSVSTTQIYTKVATKRLFEAYKGAHPRAGAVPHQEPDGEAASTT